MVASNVLSPLQSVNLHHSTYKTSVTGSHMSPQPRDPSCFHKLPSIDFPHSSKMVPRVLHTMSTPTREVDCDSSKRPVFPLLLPRLQVEPEADEWVSLPRRSSTSPGTSIAMGIAAMSLRFIVHDDESTDRSPDNQMLEEETNAVSLSNNQLPPNNQVELIVDSLPTCTTYQVKSMLNPVCAQPQCHRSIRGPIGSFCKYHKASRFCRMENCRKSAKTGGYCIAHGGGKRCTYVGCTKSAKQGGYCIAHGGGKRCTFPQCTKSALVGGCCSAHGGGHKCSTLDCTKIALVGGFCIAHGGGKRCQVAHCDKSAVGGVCCVAHGGGKRCQALGCRKGAVKSGLCIRHGAKREEKNGQDTVVKTEAY